MQVNKEWRYNQKTIKQTKIVSIVWDILQLPVLFTYHIDGLAQECSNFIVNVLELLLSYAYAKLSLYNDRNKGSKASSVIKQEYVVRNASDVMKPFIRASVIETCTQFCYYWNVCSLVGRFERLSWFNDRLNGRKDNQIILQENIIYDDNDNEWQWICFYCHVIHIWKIQQIIYTRIHPRCYHLAQNSLKLHMAKGTRSRGLCAPISIIQGNCLMVLGKWINTIKKKQTNKKNSAVCTLFTLITVS